MKKMEGGGGFVPKLRAQPAILFILFPGFVGGLRRSWWSWGWEDFGIRGVSWCVVFLTIRFATAGFRRWP